MFKSIQLRLQNSAHGRIIIAAILAFAIVLILMFMRVWAAIILRHETNAQSIIMVHTISAERAPLLEDIVLPGNVLAWHEAPIYARTKGYIKTWYVDIGSHVDKGSLMAVIETPELDAQLRQAEADLNVAIADDKLAQITAVRWKNLVKTDSVSKQETDEKVDTAIATAARVVAYRANRDRLKELVSFERLIAPFKGIISYRATDIGDLINIGSAPAEVKPLFRVVQINPLRLYVKIPQTYSSRIKPDMKVSLQFAEHPGQRFPARLLDTAHAIDPTTRTLLAQFVVENKNEELLPGGYTEVHFEMPSYPDAVRIPIGAMIFRKSGLQVATLDKNNRVVLKKVNVDRDFGNFIEIASGISVGEKIIINPSDSIYNGQQVRVDQTDNNQPSAKLAASLRQTRSNSHAVF